EALERALADPSLPRAMQREPPPAVAKEGERRPPFDLGPRDVAFGPRLERRLRPDARLAHDAPISDERPAQPTGTARRRERPHGAGHDPRTHVGGPAIAGGRLDQATPPASATLAS